jgi:hypothetical protein
MKFSQFVILGALTVSLAAQQDAPMTSSTAIFERTKAATVIILAGEGGGLRPR